MNNSNRFTHFIRIYENSYGLFPKTRLTFVIYLLLIMIGFMVQAQHDLSLPKDKIHLPTKCTGDTQLKAPEGSHLLNGGFTLKQQ